MKKKVIKKIEKKREKIPYLVAFYDHAMGAAGTILTPYLQGIEVGWEDKIMKDRQPNSIMLSPIIVMLGWGGKTR